MSIERSEIVIWLYG